MTDSADGAGPNVTVVTLNWNGREHTIECLQSLSAVWYDHFRVVVVDNGSTDGSAALIRERFPLAKVIENGRNLGYAEGFNVGLNYAFSTGADYVLVLNNDTVVDPDVLTALVAVAEQDQHIGFVSGKVFWYSEPERLQTTGRLSDPMMLVGKHVGGGELDRGQFEVQRDYDFMDDVFLLVRREAFESVGGYDPNFFLYYEETDWCARVRRAGYRIVYAPRAKIWHKGQIGNTGLDLSPARIRFLQRNQMIFMRRNGTQRQWKSYWRRTLLHWPRRMANYLKAGEWRKSAAYTSGLASGLIWVLRSD